MDPLYLDFNHTLGLGPKVHVLKITIFGGDPVK